VPWFEQCAAFVCTSDTHHQSHFDLRFFASLSHDADKAAKFDVKRYFRLYKKMGKDAERDNREHTCEGRRNGGLTITRKQQGWIQMVQTNKVSMGGEGRRR
jgi:hypothetical protein